MLSTSRSRRKRKETGEDAFISRESTRQGKEGLLFPEYHLRKKGGGGPLREKENRRWRFEEGRKKIGHIIAARGRGGLSRYRRNNPCRVASVSIQRLRKEEDTNLCVEPISTGGRKTLPPGEHEMGSSKEGRRK